MSDVFDAFEPFRRRAVDEDSRAGFPGESDAADSRSEHALEFHVAGERDDFDLRPVDDGSAREERAHASQRLSDELRTFFRLSRRQVGDELERVGFEGVPVRGADFVSVEAEELVL